MNAKQIWQTTIERLRTEVNPQVFTTWFQGTSARSFQDGVFVICVSSTFAKAQLESRFLDLICPILTDIIGSPVELRIEVARLQVDARRNGYQTNSRRQRLLHGQNAASKITANRVSTTLRDKHIQPTLHQNETAQALPKVEQPAPQANTYRIAPEEYQTAHIYKDPIFKDPVLKEPPAPAYQPSIQQFSPTYPELGEQQVEPRELPKEKPPEPEVNPRAALDYVPPAPVVSTPRPLDSILNPRYTFDTFIVGNSNKLAHATSLAVAENPGHIYNPLFLYGGVGLGKTHLLHAIGHAGEEKNLNVLYTTSEKFTNEIVNAIRYQKTEEFRAKYRQIDILMIDDIQFIAGKESTEEEFFHTFNALHNANKQIVVTSDRPPKAINSLQDRLRSRFEWGLLADVRPPEYEHRLNILRSKCESLRFSVPKDVIEYIARPECSSVRELEGALNRVIAYGTLNDAPLTIELAAQALEHIYDKKPPIPTNELTTQEVLEGVSQYYDVRKELLQGKQRDRSIVWPRQVAMYLMREETTASLLQIGAELGGRDHTTIMHGWEKVHAEISNNDVIRQEIAAVLSSLHAHNYHQ